MDNYNGTSTNMNSFKATNLLNLIKTKFINSMPLKKHRCYLKIYDDSFTGKEAVNFMLEILPSIVSKKVVLTRSNCEQLLNFLMSRNIFYNVRKELDTKFKDDFSIYKFYDNYSETVIPVKRSYSVNDGKIPFFNKKPSKSISENSETSTKRSLSTYDFPEFATTNIKLIKFFGLNEEISNESKNVEQKRNSIPEKSFNTTDNVNKRLSFNEFSINKQFNSCGEDTCTFPKYGFEEISSINITSWKYCITSFIQQNYYGKEIFKLLDIEDDLVAWNCEKIGSKGIVKCFREREEISSHLLRMMRFLAKYPNDSNNIIEYDKQYYGIELDTYRNILSEISRKGIILPAVFGNILVDIFSLNSMTKHKNDFSPIIKKIKETQLTKFFNRTSNKSVNFGVFSKNQNRSSFHNFEKKNKIGSINDETETIYEKEDDAKLDKYTYIQFVRNSPSFINRKNNSPDSSLKKKEEIFNSPKKRMITDDLKKELYSYVLLLLPPPIRRKLHIILRFMKRISENNNIKLSQKNSNKVAVLKTMTPLLITTKNQANFYFLSSVVEYLMDNETELFKIPDKLINDRNVIISDSKLKISY
ncbi:Rho GTPase-activating protein domain and DEP domain and Rho GTPase activation protein domain and Winged helix-turn-helix DNA-binding domain-containing protein [Strongyloides ratti]|uniref:Rho GTPase-activating protein domain and DEP domain and Rho GTPase activation protein domain and Winged helix-turn-helix DNA-binding domain-containing protein n=1 Tax=Strongyloides ratti TaxID=34506 RepID=A0A090LMP6_STRRB|nr:Rho GTPase-activating protein domain and DEP domain and Rho GTPase activation protein domain and Winged helix-turn-helix DNA-binding domain-containing protein [Strongyloides ratti]CEF68795.1 Rho GTPase-activating protein domain and DEP domain and Rho GTPase activation protein domain and Winged helix-turn-helix DNA-binding domain-containing protein [Strongyloides ratti]